MTKLIEFKHVQKKYDRKYVIDDLNLAIKKGEIFVLVGPSGSGKTTTLKMINGLSKPSAGDIYFKGKSLNEYNLQKMRWNMGYVLQQIALFPTMTVKQNIEVIPEMLGWEKQKRADRVDELLQKVGLSPDIYRDRMSRELSGGEQQRIGIIRAIAASPDVILMDEPFSALDPISRNSLQELVLSLHEELGTTIVFVTHNMEEAIKLGDRIAFMKDGEIIQCDTPEQLLMNPKNDYVRHFFNEPKQTKEWRVEDLVVNGYFLNEIPENARQQVCFDTPMKEVYSLLSVYPSIVIVEKQRSIGSLTSKEIFAFLSREEEGNENI
ncbi:ABC transporter ATP-binding protein [Enterococcus faecium]|uniref:ABC transporter ATP-binding protein n=1 Tax=Enterococcus faecium TaxID=1352 RepID=UPI001F53049B|nr:ABC transporter ATP-binding protein [Enterococcus faecium]MCI1179601.1 ABC transporter ATP-binding protein [Enterococcus faecium]MCT9085572.1 ABC transporter ATP-binding protein [Enterococcus faecium]